MEIQPACGGLVFTVDSSSPLRARCSFPPTWRAARDAWGWGIVLCEESGNLSKLEILEVEGISCRRLTSHSSQQG